MREAARLVLDHDVGRLIVVADDQLLGVLARHDVLRALTRTAEQLQHVVERTLEQLEEPGVRVAVDAGSRVHLTGAVADPETAGYAGHLAAVVDGVSGVDNELTWRQAPQTHDDRHDGD